MKPRLIENWREAYKFLSVQLAALLAALSLAYDYLPAVQQYLPQGWVKWLALAIIVARVLQQKSVSGPLPQPLSPEGRGELIAAAPDVKLGGSDVRRL